MFKPYINVQRKMKKPLDALETLRGFMFSRLQKRSALETLPTLLQRKKDDREDYFLETLRGVDMPKQVQKKSPVSTFQRPH